jgi:hypothetical protein
MEMTVPSIGIFLGWDPSKIGAELLMYGGGLAGVGVQEGLGTKSALI